MSHNHALHVSTLNAASLRFFLFFMKWAMPMLPEIIGQTQGSSLLGRSEIALAEKIRLSFHKCFLTLTSWRVKLCERMS